ncbi:MAG: hypothetical protein Q3976_01785 [Corynebacterium sp.]|nr:hypothetical protein [Corynebacterium sp.]
MEKKRGILKIPYRFTVSMEYDSAVRSGYGSEVLYKTRIDPLLERCVLPHLGVNATEKDVREFGNFMWANVEGCGSARCFLRLLSRGAWGL